MTLWKVDWQDVLAQQDILLLYLKRFLLFLYGAIHCWFFIFTRYLCITLFR